MGTSAPRKHIPLLRQDATVSEHSALCFRVPPPLSLYIHMPWCVRKCPYCDFNSHGLARQGGGAAEAVAFPETAYLAALIADLEKALPLIWGRRVGSVFIGGGTPSLFSGPAVEQLLAVVRSHLPVAPDAEVTLEANPGTAEAHKFEAFRSAGVNRLSLGVQSFHPQHLRALGRVHDEREARTAAALARQYFDNINLDLMYGLPGQTLEQAVADLEHALALTPTHLSCYQLTLEPNTSFAAHPPPLPEEDLCADMQDALEARLAASGFRHYETSAFARTGHECGHNLNYWTFGDYLGIGAGAHSKLTLHDRVVRQMRWKHPEKYMKMAVDGAVVQQEFIVEPADLPGEFMMNALRLCAGFPESLFERRTGLPLRCIDAVLQKAEADGLLFRQGSTIVPSERGKRFLNRLVQRFLAAPVTGRTRPTTAAA